MTLPVLKMSIRLFFSLVIGELAVWPSLGAAPPTHVEGQPLGANVERVIAALEYLGAPLRASLATELRQAAQARHAARLQTLLDPHVLAVLHIAEARSVSVDRGGGDPRLQQAGYTPVLIKIVNEAGVTSALRIGSPQSGPVYAGMSSGTADRMQQQFLRENENTGRRTDRFLALEMYGAQPMAPRLSGLGVEYAIALIYSSGAGRREATLTFDVDRGENAPASRGELAMAFEITPALAVTLRVRDHDGTPTTGRFQFVDKVGHVYPPQTKRLAPDLFFQKHIYRADGETVLLPSGELTMYYGRGPEYRWSKRDIVLGNGPSQQLAVKLDRWIDPARRGFYSGDPHIHAAGCAHYNSPENGIGPEEVFRQVKGEALNVASVLTYIGGFDRQQHFFAASVDSGSEPLTRIKYDVEVSGFGSHALGHVCLLNLKEQIYPGADGVQGWPTWTLPVLRWTKAQGGFTGYPHPGNVVRIDAVPDGKRLLAQLDANRDGYLDATEAAKGVLPAPFAAIDANRDSVLTLAEVTTTLERVAEELPNFAVPARPIEIVVTTAHGVCDFICSMDTSRLGEWNTWYHLMNCGFPLKAAGETDWPCMSGTRVGQGRTYVQLGRQRVIDYAQWCEGLARGRSYISDGYAHALEFTVGGKSSGGDLAVDAPRSVPVKAVVAFSPETPLENYYGGVVVPGGRQPIGDTVNMYEALATDPVYQRGQRVVEVVLNGQVAARREVAADGREHTLEFNIPVERSSWIALRQFPQLHTNPVNVLVGGKPIRASRESARWALACVDQLWRQRSGRIAAVERADAARAYDEARTIYRRIIEESPP